jgi:hypothetical protein
MNRRLVRSARRSIALGPHRATVSDHRKEIVVERGGGVNLRHHVRAKDGVVTVTSSDGREKSTQIGGSPPRAIARLMLIELEEARLGNPMFKLPWE